MELSPTANFTETWALLFHNWGCSDLFGTTSVTDSFNVQGVSSHSGQLCVIYITMQEALSLRLMNYVYHPPSSDVQIFSCLWSHSVLPTFFVIFFFFFKQHPLFQNYLLIFTGTGSTILHTSPLMPGNRSTSLIDLALFSTTTLLHSCSVIPHLANSGLFQDMKWKTITKQACSEKGKIWRYAHANFQSACHLIDSTD